MIDDGNSSSTAKEAQQLIADLTHIERISNDGPLQNPLIGRIRRFEQNRRANVGPEATADEERMRAELSIRDLADLDEVLLLQEGINGFGRMDP